MEKIGESVKIKTIAVTGDISSGKSTVCQLLSSLGAYVVIADEIVHSLLQNDPSCIEKVVNAFGKEVLNEEGHISRKALANIVFDNVKKLAKLESILHPKVIAEIKKSYETAKSSPSKSMFVVEFPLLYEIEFDSWFDQVIYVKAPKELAKKWFLAKGFSEETYKERSLRLLNTELKKNRADVVIDNSGSKENLKQQVMDFLSL